MFKNLNRAAFVILFALAAVVFASAPAARAQSGDGHEYAPLLEQKLDYKNWSFKSLKDGSPVSLRDVAKDKKLVMVVYFAPWCGNWKAEAPVVWKLYDKYKKDGFEVVAVSEYATADDGDGKVAE